MSGCANIEKQKVTVCRTTGWMIKSENEVASEVVLFGACTEGRVVDVSVGCAAVGWVYEGWDNVDVVRVNLVCVAFRDKGGGCSELGSLAISRW